MSERTSNSLFCLAMAVAFLLVWLSWVCHAAGDEDEAVGVLSLALAASSLATAFGRMGPRR